MSEETGEHEIEKVQSQPLVTSQTGPRGLAEFGEPQDIQIPTVRMLQSQSESVMSGDAQPGQWAADGTIYGEWIEFVPIILTRRRVYFDEEDRRNQKCWSHDSVINKDGVPCVQCPYQANSDISAHWDIWKTKPPDGSKPRKAPPCNLVHQWVGLVVNADNKDDIDQSEFESPTSLPFMSTSLRFSKRMAGLLQQRGADIWHTTLKIGSSRSRNEQGQWFTPHVIEWFKTTAEVFENHQEVFEGVYEAVVGGHAKLADAAIEPADSDEVPF